MRMFLIAGAMLLAACTPSVAPVSNSTAPVEAAPAPAQGPNVAAIDAKAMYAAEALFNVPAAAYITLDGKGLIKPADKVYAKEQLSMAYNALLAARQAYARKNSAEFKFAVAALKGIADDLAKKGFK